MSDIDKRTLCWSGPGMTQEAYDIVDRFCDYYNPKFSMNYGELCYAYLPTGTVYVQIDEDDVCKYVFPTEKAKLAFILKWSR